MTLEKRLFFFLLKVVLPALLPAYMLFLLDLELMNVTKEPQWFKK